MARKRHEEHVNHESWAIPYGDLITLLLAFFVVMYSISSVNEGKYRVLSDALSEAFGGTPKSLKPIQIGDVPQRGATRGDSVSLVESRASEQSVGGTMRELQNPAVYPSLEQHPAPAQQANASGATGYEASPPQTKGNANTGDLKSIGDQIQQALGEMIKSKLVILHRTSTALEVEIATDILFPSGSSAIAEGAKPILGKVAGILKKFPNSLRIEGYTDNQPIHTFTYPSNWELSASRAATVVHLFQDQGVDPSKMTVAGFGEFRPVGTNDTAEGRNHNRRVIVVIQAPAGSQVPAEFASAGEAPAQETSATVAESAAVAAPEGSAKAADTKPDTSPVANPVSPPPFNLLPIGEPQ